MAELTEKEKKQANIGCAIMLGIVVVVAIFMSRGPSKPYEPDKFDASMMAESFVRDHLKAPSTAKFARFSKDNVSRKENGDFVVLGYVDSQNSFGAMIRTHYVATVRYIGDKKWQLEDLKWLP